MKSSTGLMNLCGVPAAAEVGVGAWVLYSHFKHVAVVQTTFPTPVGPIPERAYRSFLSNAYCINIENPYDVVRYFGGTSGSVSHYFTFDTYDDAESARYSLVTTGGTTCECRSVCVIRVGVRVCLGSVAPDPSAGLPGGGSQVYVFDLRCETHIDTTCGLSTWTYPLAE